MNKIKGISLALLLTTGVGTGIAEEKPAAAAPSAVPTPEAAAKAETGSKAPTVIMKTSMGDIRIELNEEKAPITVKNFLKYVDAKYYDGTVFHRVIPGFMIQGGGFTAELRTQKGLRGPIKNEGKNGLKNSVGTIAMARTGDPNSATAQFFINVNSNSNLNYPKPDGHGYAVFGKVTEGLDVVNKIKSVKTGAKGRFRSDVPKETVLIKEVVRAK